jgi:quinol monooxygenase YgiN
MTEIFVIARIKAKAGAEEAVERAVVDLAVVSREEDGCLIYDTFVSTLRQGEILIYEVWRDDVALTGHAQSEHINTFKFAVQNKAEVTVEKLIRNSK